MSGDSPGLAVQETTCKPTNQMKWVPEFSSIGTNLLSARIACGYCASYFGIATIKQTDLTLNRSSLQKGCD